MPVRNEQRHLAARVLGEEVGRPAFAAQDVDLMYDIGRDLAFSARWPEWKTGSEFKAIRDKSAAVRK